MENSVVPIIVVICYLMGEIYKFIFRKKTEIFKLIPVIVAILGGILGVVVFIIDKTMIFNVANILVAMLIGIISGTSSTGTNQIIKQIFKKGEKENEWNNK